METPGKLVINIDAGTDNRIDRRGLDVIIRDHAGNVVLYQTIIWPYPISVEAQEALAIKWGIITALEADLSGFYVVKKCRCLSGFGVPIDGNL